MSQLRALGRELRAVLSTALVCALVFGLVFSSVARAAGSAPATQGASKVGAYAHCVERFAHPAATPEKQASPATKNDRSDGRHHCPECCLAAHAAALPPERFAPVPRPVADRAARAYRLPVSARAPDRSPTSAVNGARAPPTLT